MYSRIFHIDNELDENLFLFGARQTGKSTILRSQIKGSIYIDLLDTKLKSRFSRNPGLLYDMLISSADGTIVVIDEIPEVPELLDEVHRLISERDLRFVLCGSSARKLKRKGYNTLGGRAVPCFLHPLVSAEIPDFDLDHALLYGMLPPHYTAKNATRRISAYVDVYLKEEIKEEALVRNLGSFQRFLEIAALTDGEMVNYRNIAQDCGVSANTVSNYFNILEDTLVGYMVPAYRKVMKRRLVQAPKFYYFDVGLVNHMLHRDHLVRGTAEYGHAFEHFVIQELVAYLDYEHRREQLSYWRTYSGYEVDAVLGDAQVAIEIKSVDEVMPRHLKGLKAFAEEHADARLMIVSLDPIRRTSGDIEILPIMDFLGMLWRGEILQAERGAEAHQR